MRLRGTARIMCRAPGVWPRGVDNRVGLDDVTGRHSDTARPDGRLDQTEVAREPAESVITALQRSLLPEFLPVLPGVRTAALYRPANDPEAAGGDWFDAVPLGDRRIAVLIGDVPGNGTRACVLMGQLRSVLNAALLNGLTLPEALAHLDRFVACVPAAAGTTLCVAVHDPATGELAYATCGHCPPLVLSASGTVGYLPGSGGVPLGMPGGGVPLVRSARLGPHDVVVLHTDGLVKHPGAPLSEGLRTLLAEATRLAPGLASGELADPVHQLCQGLVESVTDAGVLDDVSIIALQRLDRISPDYREQLTCGPGVPGEVRTGLGRWLEGVGADAEDVRDVQLAVGEAVINVIEHAYPDGPGPVLVEASHDPSGRVYLTVSDQGRWLTPLAEPDLRGRGLRLIRACMDSVEIDSSASGTTLLLDRVLRRAPILDGATGARPPVPSGRAEPEFSASIRRSSRPCLVVGGPVDAGTIQRFQAAIQDSGRGGALPLDLDLSAVSYLGSAGVRTLHELAEQMAVDGRALRLVAPPDSPARYLLDLSGLTDLVSPHLPEPAPVTHREMDR